MNIKHSAWALVLIFCSALFIATEAQTARLSTVNVTSDGERVHIAAQGDVSEMRIEVSDEAGDVVFQSGEITGQQLDWKMTDAQGGRVQPGTYLVTVTFRTAAGKLRKRVEQVTVSEDEKATTKPTPAAPEVVQATVTTYGTPIAGRLTKFQNSTQISNSVVTESAGNVGVGTSTPKHRLAINGGPTWTSNGWHGALELTNASAIGWQANSAGQRFGMGHTNGGFYIFRTASNPGTSGSPANYDLVITDTGHVGIGTISPTSQLTVSGGSFPAISASGDPAISADGNIVQSIDSLGGVKAMVRFQGNGAYILCYNGVTGSVTGGGCGFTVTPAGGSLYNINFGSGFDIQHRFISLSGSSTIYVFGFPDANTLQVSVGNATSGYAYYVIVF